MSNVFLRTISKWSCICYYFWHRLNIIWPCSVHNKIFYYFIHYSLSLEYFQYTSLFTFQGCLHLLLVITATIVLIISIQQLWTSGTKVNKEITKALQDGSQYAVDRLQNNSSCCGILVDNKPPRTKNCHHTNEVSYSFSFKLTLSTEKLDRFWYSSDFLLSPRGVRQ